MPPASCRIVLRLAKGPWYHPLMAVTDAELDHLARLARLELEAGERAALRDDLGKILAYFELLAEVDTDGVEELVRPVVPEVVSRPDQVAPSLPRERVSALANAEQDGFLRVPRTVDET